jgi:hypothetical protein
LPQGAEAAALLMESAQAPVIGVASLVPMPGAPLLFLPGGAPSEPVAFPWRTVREILSALQVLRC